MQMSLAAGDVAELELVTVRSCVRPSAALQDERGIVMVAVASRGRASQRLRGGSRRCPVRCWREGRSVWFWGNRYVVLTAAAAGGRV